MLKRPKIKKLSIPSDTEMVAKLSKKRKLNKGKGYKADTCRRVLNGKRHNSKVLELYVEVIQNRLRLLEK